LQRLTSRQRAVLLLRDVIGWRTRESPSDSGHT
jgi:DNA-directed RNA polymerase specialized sigma24 family protein